MASRADAEQIAKNETLFREVNKRIKEIAERFSSSSNEFLCECGNDDCIELVVLSGDEYEAAHADGRHFVVAPGHELPQTESVVAEHQRFVVVEKPAEALHGRTAPP